MSKIKQLDYKPRISDKILDFKLQSKGAVLIEGAKWCGKTTSARQFAKSEMSFGGNNQQNIEYASIDTKAALEGETPRLFDEWQEVPQLWDTIRYEVDNRNAVGQFILTGSTVPKPKDARGNTQMHHTGTGRYTYLKMRPMSLYESGESNGKISLSKLFDAPMGIDARSDLSLEDIAFLACRGGWPFATFLSGNHALEQAKDYREAIVHQDISRTDGVERNPQTASEILRSYARHQGSQASLEEIARDVRVAKSTARSYIDALVKIFAIEDVMAWNPNLRSKAAIRTASTRYFVDPSIATSSLKAGPDGLIADLGTFGFIFETLCVRDLRVYSAPLGGNVYHFRDKSGLECDAVIVLEDGRYGLVEIKLGQTSDTIASATESLKSISDKIDTSKMPAPSFMMLITANGQYAYRDPSSGVYVVPVGCLKD